MSEDEKLPMGKNFNCHLGAFELPSDILEIGIFDDHVKVECVDGCYLVHKYEDGNLNITKVLFSDGKINIEKVINK